MTPAIRESAAEDAAAIEALYVEGFPEEDLLPLVRALLAGEGGGFSLVAGNAGAPLGHVVFTPCRVTPGGARVGLLGPLVVAETARRRGLGGALIRAGLDRLRGDGVEAAFALGDPAFYGRFGFQPGHGVAAPYPLPEGWDAAWGGLALRPDALETLRGTLEPPPVWRRRDLWSA